MTVNLSLFVWGSGGEREFGNKGGDEMLTDLIPVVFLLRITKKNKNDKLHQQPVCQPP